MIRIFLALLLIPSFAFGQLTVTTEVSEALVGFNSAKVVGGNKPIVLFSGDFKRSNIGFVKIETDAATVQVEAEDSDRNQVEIKKLDNAWYVDTPGRYWVRVTAVDFDKRIFATRTVVLDIVGCCSEVPTEPENPVFSWIVWVQTNRPAELSSYFPQIAKNFRATAGESFDNQLQLSTHLRDLNRKTLGNDWQKMLEFSVKLSEKLGESEVSLDEMGNILIQIAEGFEK
jgi:hypothetical protein